MTFPVYGIEKNMSKNSEIKSDANNTIAKRLAEKNIQLPNLSAPVANYIPYKLINNVLYVSGQLPINNDGSKIVGKLGKSLGVAEGQAAARQCGLNLIAWVKEACHGDLECVQSINQITVLVNATDDFHDHPKIANGISDLMVEVFGKEIGSHTRVAFGAGSLPFGVAVEVSGIFNIKKPQ